MDIGIFTSVFQRPSLDATLDAVLAHGLRSVQFNLECAHLPSMPDVLESAQVESIRQAFAQREMTMAAISGTFNIIHPDRQVVADGMRRLRVLAGACAQLGTEVITLSTGTRNAENMWRGHPDNGSAAAWDEMLAAMREIATIGMEYGVIMAFEPEVNNVVDSAQRARLLIDTIGSPFIKVIMDGANIFHTGELPAQDLMLADACQLLSGDIVLAHAKDLDHDGDAGHLAAGTGLLHYAQYLRELQRAGYTGPLILHGLREAQVATCVAFLRSHLQHMAA